ncbi:MAG: sulfatase [Planctomycetaceae bacterium]|nr:sulfatase [Planctomycetaceae bacterium]
MRLAISILILLFSSLAISAAEKPNILFIISDDLSAESLSCYGNEQCRTPHIDSLAQRGMKFTRAYCQYPVCGPSRAALMSGMYSQQVGVTGNGSSGNFTKRMGDRPSMAQLFKQNDWYTARVSKIYHMRVPGDITKGVDGPDHAASWTERFNAHAPEWMSEGEHIHLTNEKVRFDKDVHYGLGFGGAFYVVKGSDPTGAAQADVIASTKAVELLETHKDEPFFLAVGLVRPHVPLVAPHQYFDPYPPSKMNLPRKVEGDWNDIPKAGISKNSKAIGLAGKIDKQQQVLSAYYASVAFMDDQVGKILAALDRLDLRKNTIVIFTADHGYHLGEHDFWQKMSLHEESTRIPIIFSVPGKSPGVSHSLVQQIDIYPTLAELAELPIPKHVQGKSFARNLDDPDHQVHDEIYCLKQKSHLLRTDRWAYLQYQDGSAELYDMKNDPQQFTNLVDSPDHQQTLKELQKRLADKRQSIQDNSLPAR